MGLFLPELGCPEAFGRPAVMDWDRNLDFSAGLGQLKETRSHCRLFKGNRNTKNKFRITLDVRTNAPAEKSSIWYETGWEEEKEQEEHKIFYIDVLPQSKWP